MSYTPDASLLARLGDARLTELSDDHAAGTIDWDVVAHARREAAELIDGYCRGRYEVPFSAPVPGIIESVSTDLTVYMLYRRRFSTDMPESIAELRKNALKLLESIQRGVLQLGVDSAEPDSSGRITSNRRDEDRLFPRERLDQMP